MRKYWSGEILFCGVLKRYVSQNIVAITGTLRLNRFTLLESMYLIDRFSQLSRREVALHFINIWDINDLSFDYYWKQLQLPSWRYVCVTDVFIRVALYLTIMHSTCNTSCPWNRNPTSSFSGTGRARSANSIAWKRWLLWNNWLLQWSKKSTVLWA